MSASTLTCPEGSGDSRFERSAAGRGALPRDMEPARATVKDVYAYHPESGEYLGTVPAQESPREPGVWLIPAWATEKKPPKLKEGHRLFWSGKTWKQQEINE